jgi:hypothetical protein
MDATVDDAFSFYGYEDLSSVLSAIRWLQEDNSTSTNTTTVNNNAAFNDAATLRNTLRLYGTLFVVLLLVFCFLRRKFPRVYNLRDWIEPIKTPLAAKKYSFLGWMYKL